MRNLRRAPAPLVLVLALAGSLSACSDDSEPTSLPDVSSQTCRLAAVTHASLTGPRGSAVGGQFNDGLMASYDTAIAGLSTAVAGEGEVEPEIINAVVDLVAGYSRTRANVQTGINASSWKPSQTKALTSAEERLYQALVEVCPVLEDTEES